MDFNSLDRFVQAQTLMYPSVLKQIQNGKKTSHWMWFMFPQLRGLGTSTMAHLYGISGLGEAKAYLAHPVLSGRLYKLCGELLKHKDKTALEIFGDTLKCITMIPMIMGKDPSGNVNWFGFCRRSAVYFYIQRF